MGRPPSNGVPSFRFNSVEVAEMEALLQAYDYAMPTREVLEALAEKFSLTAERSGKFVVQMKQVWHWFQNRRYAVRAKASRPSTQDESSTVTNIPQAPQPKSSPQDTATDVTEAPQSLLSPGSRNGADNNSMEFEAKSARDGAWYDVAMFLSYRSVEAADPEVLVRFAGFGAEEDEWVDIGRLVRKRSLPCESSECVAVLQGDLILCFQEGKEQALYFDAHVLDAQRRRHDVRGCRCRFLVRYDHDQSEEIVPLRKVCRRPETDYRLQQLYALNESTSTNQPKTGAVPFTDNSLRVYPPVEPLQKQRKIEDLYDNVPVLSDTSETNLLVETDSKAQETNVEDSFDADTTGNLSALQSNDSPQPQDLKADSPTMEISDAGNNSLQLPDLKTASPTMKISDAGNNSLQTPDLKTNSPTMEILDAGNNSLQPRDLKTDSPTMEISDADNNSLQPRDLKTASPTMKISDAGNNSLQPPDLKTDSPMEISDAGDNSLQPQVMKIASPCTMEISDVGNISVQPEVMKIASPGTVETSDAGNISLQPEVVKIASPNTMEISNAGIVVQQPKVTEIIIAGDLESLNAAPTIAMQKEAAEIVSDANLGNSPVPHVFSQGNLPVPPQSEIEEISGSLESANISPGNAV